MPRLFIVPALLLLLGASSRAESLAGFDVYRSSGLDAAGLRKDLARKLTSLQRIERERGRAARRQAAKLKKAIEGLIRKKGDFAFVELHYSRHKDSSGDRSYVVVDVVDAADRQARMPFRPAPTGQVQDPDGLLAAWRQYSEAIAAKKRESPDPGQRRPCGGFYCPWAPIMKGMDKFEDRFRRGAAEHQAGLRQVALADADPGDREAALFVLAFSTNGADVAALMTDALADPDPAVRAAAFQVLSDIATYHKKVSLEVGRLLPALDYPRTEDRARALSLMVGIIENVKYKHYALGRAPRWLIPLLKLAEPSNHDLAFTLLSLLSEETYGRRDYAKWEAWASQHSVKGSQDGEGDGK